MNSSFSRVKRFLGPPLNISTTSVSSQSPKTLTETKTAPSLPELMCENEDLKEQIQKLRKQKQYLERSVQRVNPNFESQNRRYSHGQQSPRICRSLQKQSRNDNNTRNFVTWWKKHSEDSRFQSPKNNKSEIQNKKYSDISFSLIQQKQKNRKLSEKVAYLTRTIQYHENDKAQLQKIMQELSHKLQLSTNYISKLDKIPNPQHYEHYLQRLTQQIKQKETKNLQLLTQVQQTNQNQTYFQAKSESNTQLIHQLINLKQQNYQLRDNINQLMLNNTYLKSKVVVHSTAIGHLWQVKQIQQENMKMCLADIRGLSQM